MGLGVIAGNGARADAGGDGRRSKPNGAAEDDSGAAADAEPRAEHFQPDRATARIATIVVKVAQDRSLKPDDGPNDHVWAGWIGQRAVGRRGKRKGEDLNTSRPCLLRCANPAVQ